MKAKRKLLDKTIAAIGRMLDAGDGDDKIARTLKVTRHDVRKVKAERVETALASQMSLALVPAGGALSFYDTARQALAQAKNLGDVKDVADRATALKEYARRASDRILEIDAAELRIRAERRLGEMLAATPLHPGGRPRKDKAGARSELATLKEIGVDHKLSIRAQKLAALPAHVVETRIAAWRVGAERGAERISIDLLRNGDKKERRNQREAELAEKLLALPDKKYAVILADPEWKHVTWSSETGINRAAENYYPVSSTTEIAAREVPSIAATDCVLFLWATQALLLDALHVMQAWGFDYKSQFVWHKIYAGDQTGLGYWNRSVHELLLIGTCGRIPAPAPGQQWKSLIAAEVRGHSVKPDWQYELIEAYFPNLPKIELNARRARVGWDRWGLDAPAQERQLDLIDDAVAAE
jgi:N6-adenosine-specific RNA methylase IME4